MKYAVEGSDLCIRIPLDAIAQQALEFGATKVLNKADLALSMGRELCECENAGEEYYLNATLDAAIVRVIESADPSIEFVE